MGAARRSAEEHHLGGVCFVFKISEGKRPGDARSLDYSRCPGAGPGTSVPRCLGKGWAMGTEGDDVILAVQAQASSHSGRYQRYLGDTSRVLVGVQGEKESDGAEKAPWEE